MEVGGDGGQSGCRDLVRELVPVAELVPGTCYGRGYYGAVLEAWYAVVVVFVMVLVLVLVLGGVLDHAYFSRHVPSQPDAQGS